MQAQLSEISVTKTLIRVMDWVFPRFCLVCGDEKTDKSDICDKCRDFLSIINIFCPACGVSSKKPLICGNCQKTQPYFDSTYTGFNYSAPMDGFVKRLKYDKQLEFARTLGELFAARWMGQSTPQPELIVPVPLHRERLRERGFNQSLEIAREVGKRPELRIDYQSVIRVKPTPPQTDLPLKKRRSNVRNAFKVIKPIEAQHVAILDDVMTTGSTADELARCLKQSGVERIDVWTVTRASNQINQYSCC